MVKKYIKKCVVLSIFIMIMFMSIFLIYKSRKINFYSSYQGLLTPMDGSYNDWIYNTMSVIDDEIYYTFNHPQTHWNAAEDQGTTLGIYNPQTGLKVFKEILYNGQPVTTHTGWSINNTYYVLNQTDLFYSEDSGETWKHNSVEGLRYEPNYIYSLKSGRLISVFDDRNFKKLAISDDNGKTWEEYEAFYGEYEFTHVSMIEIDDCIVAYFFEEYTTNPEDISEVRCYSVSYNQGESWSMPKECQGDLRNAGLGYMSGTIQYLGGKYHYITGERLFPCEENDFSAGKLKWYSGTKEELLNGSLKYVDCIYDMQISNNSNFNWDVLKSDFGNVGGCTWNNNIFIACGSLVYSKSIEVISNQQQKLFCVSTIEKKDLVDVWIDNKWNEKMERTLSQKNISSWDYYFYGKDYQNMFEQNKIYQAKDKKYGFTIAVDNYNIPLDNYDYRIEVIYQMSNLADNLFVGVQHPDGTCDGVGRSAINLYGFNCGIDMNTAMLSCGSGDTSYPAYMILEKINDEYMATINGTTIYNWRYHWKAASKVNQDIKQENFIITQKGIEAWINNASEWEMNNQLAGLKMCRIKLLY